MKRKTAIAVLGIILAFALCGCVGMEEASKELEIVKIPEMENTLDTGASGGQNESTAATAQEAGFSGTESPETENPGIESLGTKSSGTESFEAKSSEATPEIKELWYGAIGNLGMGTLAYTAPVKENEDYRMYFFASETGKGSNTNLADASFVFPDAREGNKAIGRWKEIYYVDTADVSGDGAGDIFVVAAYEKDGEAYYDTRVYVGKEKGYSLDLGLTQKLNEEYGHAEDYPVQSILFMLSESGKTEKTTGTAGTGRTWQESYRTILCDLENYLSDPYKLRFGFDGNVYLGIHDFDHDDMPELVVGDSVSAAVFTYLNGKAMKIADLYEPEEWGGINGLFYKNNTLLLVSSGSGGSGYVCFTYKEGNYIKGFCDDYNQDIGMINESQVSRAEFERWFAVDELKQNSKVSFRQIDKDKKTVCIDSHTEEIGKLDFQLIQW